ncbi:hypothetical protein B0T26DRAFT_453470 [Lasiosphaeria miniovina]|uniref:Uncharacterized protein n=1 Tax=Lasiosphaeria miniovina TaxID=1954250 RepID=A0AA39ZZC3_9PEZI|nr:uncharacterized protein B0T26DRAFT_453470 [Lasiosphaeria miniovina]KAK0706420.1 hypothetical protein B0T26DRAFT_453470 [Lasiosphaeria miniovina]
MGSRPAGNAQCHRYHPGPYTVRSRRLLVFLLFSISLCGVLVLVSDLRLITYALVSSISGISWLEITTALARVGGLASDELSDANTNKKTWPRPRFHLVVDAREKRSSLCKTLFSAVIQGYPPPILVGYTEEGEEEEPISPAGLVSTTLEAISTNRLGDEDVVLWLAADHWVQLPIEVLVRRYLQQTEVLGQRLARQYPLLGFEQRILFAASKSCLYKCNDTDVLPESSLPRDVYGSFRGIPANISFSRPRFIAPGAFIGRVRDVVPFLRATLKVFDSARDDKLDEAIVWDQLFRSQEAARQLRLSLGQTSFERFRSSLLTKGAAAGKWTATQKQQKIKEKEEAGPETGDGEAELGFGLDYESRIFQDLSPHSAAADVQFLRFDRPAVARSPSRSAACLYADPLALPPELRPHGSPLAHLNESDFLMPSSSSPQPPPLQPPQPDLAQLKRDVLWSTVALATNVAVPRGSIPAVLSAPPDDDADDWWWRNMYFRPHGRLLLQHYLRPNRYALAEQATRGGSAWWNARGGRGGVWTGRGGWIAWTHICGPKHDSVLFRDG